MKKHGVLIAALALAVLAPAANAQDVQVYRVTQRGMLGISHGPVPATAVDARQRVVLDIVPGSPAEKAGLVKGDTIVRINGLAATSQVMSAPFEPGDSVVLRVRRDGRERDLIVVAAERTFAFNNMIQDSVFGRMSVILESMRGNVDSLMPRMQIQRYGSDSTVTIIIGADTIVAPDGRTFRDLRVSPDSLRTLWGTRLFGDSAGTFRFSEGRPPMFFRDSVGGNVFRFFGDSLPGMGPLEIMTAGSILGMRAVAGAELSDLNEGLGEYFGTASGVLVMNARAGTPAERAGLRAGDVITRVNGEAVRNIADLRRRIDQSSGAIQLVVLRRGQNVDLTLQR